MTIGLPLAASYLLNSCASIVDGIMVSSIGENMVTAVGNARNIITLYDMIGWGLLSGISAFGAQFYGAKQKNNLAKTFGLCIVLTLTNSLFWIFITYLFGQRVLLWYLDDIDIVNYSLMYLKIFAISLIPLSLSNTISTLFKCCHNTKVCFINSLFWSLMNCILNYCLIYIFNLGIAGAAYATLITTTGNLLTFLFILIKTKPMFYNSFKETFNLNINFVKPVILKIMPIIINETLFGAGQTLFNKAFGTLGSKAMSAHYVAVEVWNMLTFVIWGYGAAIGVMIGTTLGEGKIEQAKKEANYQLGLAFVIGSVLAILMFLLAPSFVNLYHVIDVEVYYWTIGIIYVFSFKVFLRTFTYTMFSTLKAGGDTKIINLYDSGFVYIFGITSAFFAVYVLKIENIVLLTFIVQIEQVIRCIFTLKRYKSGVWALDLTQLVS